jgi:hypothetical protein
MAGLTAVLFGLFSSVFTVNVGTAEIQTAQAAPAFANPAFQKLWLTTDALVDNGAVKRSYLWGPARINDVREFYADSPNGWRLVQYFDKTRMEINNPYADPNNQFYVSNGLVVVEMVSGNQQDGDSRFNRRSPEGVVPVAGDPAQQNPDSPTYASFRAVASIDNDSNVKNRAPQAIGSRATATINKQGTVGSNPALGNDPNSVVAYYENTLGHNVPKAFWDYLNQVGPKLGSDGSVINGQPVFNWISAMGFPVTEAFWTEAVVAGQRKTVLVQLFQRRVLTYTPSNPDGFKVEMGNVGLHYYQWRYPDGNARNRVPPADVPKSVPRVGYGINGHMFYVNRNEVTDWTSDLGVRWFRQQIEWKDIEVAPGQYIWTELDNIIDHLYSRGYHILISPVKAPSFYAANNGIPSDPETFARFAGVLADRYKGRVDAYQIWNEPNLAGESGAPINVRRYVELLEKGSASIRAKDPYAIIAMAALSPTGVNDPNAAIDDVEYLKQLLAFNNAEVCKSNYFDVVGAHTGSNLNPPDTFWPNNPGPGPGWQNHPSFYFRRVEQLYEALKAVPGCDRQVWLTEFGWASSPNPAPGYEYARFVSEQQQGDYVRRAYEIINNNYPWMGVTFLWQLNFGLPEVTSNPNDEKVAWGILRRDKTKRPSYFVLQSFAKNAR